MSEMTKISKFLSLVLRHQPEKIGIQLDREGWTDIEKLLQAIQQQGLSLDLAMLHTLVEQNDKKRFQISENDLQIRAVQGHSTASVNRQMQAIQPPTVLYHGTASRFLDSIWQQGLLAGQRHAVHLSADIETATTVGQRYGKPVVLSVNTAQMVHDGFEFYQAENGVWLTEHVPAQYLSVQG